MYNIVFVIGGPGVGKGTQCSLLVKEWPTKLVHLSLGDILRDERDKPSSKWGDTLQKNLKEGLIGSKEMVVELLQGKLEGLSAQDKQKVILLDGFPRTIDRCLFFEERIGKPVGCVVLEASTKVLKQRLAGRTRSDDHSAAVEKRMATWHEHSADVVGHYRSQGKLIEVNAEGEKEEVLRELGKQMANKVPAVGFFLLGRGRSKSAGEEDVEEGAAGGFQPDGTRTVT